MSVGYAMCLEPRLAHCTVANPDAAYFSSATTAEEKKAASGLATV